MNNRADQYKSLETLAVLALVSLIVALLFSLNLFLYLSVCFLIVGLFFKKTSSIITSYWMRFAAAFGVINSKILLSLVFFSFLLPIAVIYRLVKGDTLQIKRQTLTSYWKQPNRVYQPEDFEKQW